MPKIKGNLQSATLAIILSLACSQCPISAEPVRAHSEMPSESSAALTIHPEIKDPDSNSNSVAAPPRVLPDSKVRDSDAHRARLTHIFGHLEATVTKTDYESELVALIDKASQTGMEKGQSACSF